MPKPYKMRMLYHISAAAFYYYYYTFFLNIKEAEEETKMAQDYMYKRDKMKTTKKKRSNRPFFLLFGGRWGVDGGQCGWRVIFHFFFSKTLQSTQHIYKLELKLAFERKFITYTGRADSR